MPKQTRPPLASELSDDDIDRLEENADAYYEERLREERLSMRWPRASLETVRQAARLLGVPYQTYVKQVAVRQAITDLKDAAAAGIHLAVDHQD
jgi:predicted DNA binding CopG/RHH family protein